jgi:hypothetical protein
VEFELSTGDNEYEEVTMHYQELGLNNPSKRQWWDGEVINLVIGYKSMCDSILLDDSYADLYNGEQKCLRI